jgi:hypothetical protein
MTPSLLWPFLAPAPALQRLQTAEAPALERPYARFPTKRREVSNTSSNSAL